MKHQVEQVAALPSTCNVTGRASSLEWLVVKHYMYTSDDPITMQGLLPIMTVLRCITGENPTPFR